MIEILLMLHLFGFAAGASASIGNFVVGNQIAAAPADARVLGRLPPILARVGQVGLALLWITGVLMVYTAHGGFGGLATAFWIKFVGVVVLTVLAVLIDLRIKAVGKGDLRAGAAIPMLGRIAGITLVLIVVFAVIAFR